MAHPSHSYSTTQTVRLIMSSFRGKTVQLASHGSKEFGAFCFDPVAEGRLRIKENTPPFDTYPTQSGTARVPRVGECAANRYGGPLFIRDKNRMR